MGLFRRASSTSPTTSSTSGSDATSIASNRTSVTSTSASAPGPASPKSPKVKPGDLHFANSASPNSRLLPLSEAALGPPSLARSTSASSSSILSSQDSTTSPSLPSNGLGLVAPSKSTRAPPSREDSDSSEDDGAEDDGEQGTDPQEANGNGTPAKSLVATVSAAIASALPRSESPAPVSDTEESDDFASAAGGSDAENSEAVLQSGASTPPKKRSHAATLAHNAMDSKHQLWTPKNKPLSSLTFDDVKLTDDELKGDIDSIFVALHLFMNSRMVEAEEICMSASDHRLYYSVGFALIQSIKSLATFEPEDLEAAISCCKDSLTITSLLRKKNHSLFESGLRLAKGSTSVSNIASMTLVQRHAELVWAECTLLRAVLGIIYSGDFIAFLKEALNMRNAYAIYRTLAKFVAQADAAYDGEEDPSIDQHFRSGVFLGNGLISLILSLLPSTVLKIMEVSDRDYALKTLMKAGKWSTKQPEPGMEVEKEGIRRQICDMVLLMHHLVISSYLPVGKVDVALAENILDYELDRYENGIFWLYFAGRLNSTHTQLEMAVDSFHKAIQAQREFLQLAHICYWDLGLVSLAMASWQKGHQCFTILDKESNWSKSIYAYAKATTLYEQDAEPEKVMEGMKTVPDLMQRIANKSIPLEKFVSRRARKFVAQGGRLCLPGIELGYILNCLALSPRFVLVEQHLDQISTVLAELHEIKDPSTYHSGTEYWDDYCLAHLLRAIVLRFIAYPEPHVQPRPAESPIPQAEAGEQALISLNNVLKHGKDLVLDHFIVWFAHYELGRLYESREEYTKSVEQYNLIMSGKIPELGAKKKSGKVTMQNAVILRANSALQGLREAGKI